MNQELRILIKKLIGGEITDLEFLDLVKGNIEITSYFDKLLEVICIEKNKDDLGLLFYIGFTFDLFDERHLVMLNQLITEAWHKAHEDIAGLLQYFQSNSSVESLYKAAITKFEYLHYTNALAVKCIWALDDINTPESKEKLELLSKSKEKEIKKNALHQLKRISIKKGL
ncbi:HEAT repeat domain-containing protein [Brevibacillus sp. HB1.2]|uniref:HEAT repeat domain-containing protein n=1 Tax=Brevibacillus sp. HB1.2 TaxID=2738807 RepID=UPI001576D4E5|nr:HEAT repeat domain-containing protein [Brevibacillus sp. HB1.2]NTU21997.1 HEAT repeat domain-containing protein [Brevibacillus sp. HB1.2]